MRSSKHAKGRQVTLKQTILIIYLAIMIMLIGIGGVLYNKYSNKVDSNLPLATGDAEQSESLNNGNGGNEPLSDDPMATGNVDSDEEQVPTQDYDDVTEEPAPSASNTPVSESDKQTENPKPAQTEKPLQSTEALTKTKKLSTTYVVQKGDTLRLISQKFYQSKDYYSLIAEHNHILLINDMKVGDTLKIPALSSTTSSIDIGQQGTKDYSKIHLPATYLVRAGDTLSEVSRMFYKSAGYVDAIAKENKLDKNAGLKAGTNLVIPSLKNDRPDEENGAVGSSIHTVKSGETLYSISKIYYGSDNYVMVIAKYNHIVNINDVKAGTVLKIPKA
ncbi:LysM peptidoglycan-binding domain-containing protein [Paenibacillus glycanilyticus]|nr:LysM peptidoglycan-binding domain-containing protein [Paenibacillus glycanilyticus]